MPTVGWIHEGAVEHHQAAEDARRGPPPKTPCPYCEETFVVREAMQEHVRLYHPLAIPKMAIGGTIIGRREVVRHPLKAAGISLINCDEVEVTCDGARVLVDLKSLPRWLSYRRSEQVQMVARNHRAVDKGTTRSEWTLGFRVARPAELRVCDKAFLEILAVPQPTTADVDAFLRHAPVSAGGRDYAGALADYVIGLLLKEQSEESGIRGEMEEFRGKLASVLETLQGHQTRVARSVSAVSGFCLNTWRTLAVPSEMTELASAVGFFRSLASQDQSGRISQVSSGGEPACFVDQATKQIIDATVELLRSNAHDAVLEDLARRERDRALTEYDLVKVGVLLAIAREQRGNRRAARSQLQRLQFDGYFGHWARQRLEGR